jgi:hypothetical protein
MPRSTAAKKLSPAKAATPTTGARFTALSPTEVQDTVTGLVWSHTLTTDCVNHADAEKAVAELEAREGKGWRLPTVEELFCLADRTKRRPAIDTSTFPDTKSDWYWTSTPYAGDPACAWFVSFGDGHSYDAPRGGVGAFVRAVRGPAARPGQ